MAAGQPRHILIGSSPAHGRPSPAGAEPEGLLLRESNASPAAPSGSSPQGTGNSRKSTRLAFSKQALNRLTGRLRRPFPGPPSTRWRGHRPSTRDIPPLASGCSVIPTISWTSWRSYAARSQKRAPGYASPPRRTSPAAHEKTRAGTLRPGGRALRAFDPSPLHQFRRSAVRHGERPHPRGPDRSRISLGIGIDICLELAPCDLGVAHARYRALRVRPQGAPSRQRPASCRERRGVVSGPRKDDGGPVAQRPRRRTVRRSPSARGVGRVGGRAKGPPEHLLLDAGALGMDRLHRASWAPAVPEGVDLIRPRASGQTHAGLLAVRTPSPGWMAPRAGALEVLEGRNSAVAAADLPSRPGETAVLLPRCALLRPHLDRAGERRIGRGAGSPASCGQARERCCELRSLH